MKFRLVIFCRFSRIFSSASASTRSPAGVSATTPEEGQARPDRAVEAQGLVLAQGEVLDELAGLVLHLQVDLARADALDLGGGHALAPRHS